jgi:hypothetical protein
MIMMSLISSKQFAFIFRYLDKGQRSEPPEIVVGIVTINHVTGEENPNAKSPKLEVVEAGEGNFRSFLLVFVGVRRLRKLLNFIIFR